MSGKIFRKTWQQCPELHALYIYLNAEAPTLTRLYESIQGKATTRPGPFTPCIRPSRNTTRRSDSPTHKKHLFFVSISGSGPPPPNPYPIPLE